MDEALLRLRIDENTDATCEYVWTDEDVSLKSFKIESDGSGEAPIGEVKDGENVVRIRGLAAEKTYRLTVEYDAPEGFSEAVREPVFRVELFAPPPPRLRAGSRARRWRCELKRARPTRPPGSRGFPWPVLERGNTSFAEGVYAIELEHKEIGKSFELTHEISGANLITRWIAEGKVKFACAVASPASAYRDLRVSDTPTQLVSWDRE